MKRILYFSLVSWNWIMQRPQFISLYLSREGNKVTYLNLEKLSLNRIERKKNYPMKNIFPSKNLKIINKKILPKANKSWFVDILNVIFFRLSYNKKFDVIFLTHPYQLKYLRTSTKKKTPIIFDCMDNYAEWAKTNSELKKYLRLEKELVETARKIIVSAAELKFRFQDIYKCKNIEVIFNAFDKENFVKTNSEILLRHPNLMYIGTIGNWFDMETITHFAKNNSSFTIYLIGPIENNFDTKITTNIENIIFLGSVEHEKIPAYMNSGDIMLLPFIINEVTKYVDPVKLYEYLYLKKKVISSHWRELDKFLPFIEFYFDYDSFQNKVYELINSNIKIDPEDRIKHENWSERAKKINNLIDNLSHS